MLLNACSRLMMYDTALNFWEKAPRTKFEKVDKKNLNVMKSRLRYTKRQRLRQLSERYTYILLKQNKTVAWDMSSSPPKNIFSNFTFRQRLWLNMTWQSTMNKQYWIVNNAKDINIIASHQKYATSCFSFALKVFSLKHAGLLEHKTL